jgi:hypothetical protein
MAILKIHKLCKHYEFNFNKKNWMKWFWYNGCYGIHIKKIHAEMSVNGIVGLEYFGE